MFARSTTILAQPTSIDDGIAIVADEVMPMIMGLEGCLGLSMIVDRQSGRCIATSSWRDMDSMRATDRMLMPMRDRAAEAMRGTAMVEEWEIAALHREHPSNQGACVRVTWMQMEPGLMDHTVDVFRMRSLPALDEVAGFCSASLFVDRMTGRACASATYDSRSAMVDSRDRAMSVRDAGAQESGATITDVCEFELALAHLHVPEMA